jgi:CheY-like chemotaxis protein
MGDGSLRVLVVDDLADHREILTVLLQLWGHEASQAHDGPSGLEAWRAFQPHVVLLDLGMPRMDGYEVARRVRQATGPGRCPTLIAVSGFVREQDLARSRAAGFDLHLGKPTDLKELRRLLASLAASGPRAQGA